MTDNERGEITAEEQTSFEHRWDRFVDIVFCVDCSEKMAELNENGVRRIDVIKNFMLEYPERRRQVMEGWGQTVAQIRVRFITFGDYARDLADAILVTEFFRLPEDQETYERCVRSIKPSGGGDCGGNGMEALAYAIRSEWDEPEFSSTYKFIFMLSDFAGLPLGHGASLACYPKGMPANVDELTAWWNNVTGWNKGLIIAAPDQGSWTYLSDYWENIAHITCAASVGLAEAANIDILERLLPPDF